ncbi:hypothetical protein KAR91_18100 [Candidatus Pacearchaeota archaeon]|nr:hypothetical protein [Candidatus Pacearchaeota archaeon]
MKDIETLVDELQSIQADIKELKKTEKSIRSGIVSHYGELVPQFGTFSEKEGGIKVTITIPKKIEWDQAGLKGLLAEGAPVKTKYDVSEIVFKELDDAGKAAFMPFRTVKPGPPAIKVKFENSK